MTSFKLNQEGGGIITYKHQMNALNKQQEDGSQYREYQQLTGHRKNPEMEGFLSKCYETMEKKIGLIIN